MLNIPKDNTKKLDKNEVILPPKENEQLKKFLLGEKNTGLSTNYYKLEISDPANLKKPYICECQDIIEVLGMTFNEGESFKALWRRSARRTLGLTKDGTSNLYDAEKIKYFGDRIHKEELREQLKQIAKKKEKTAELTTPERELYSGICKAKFDNLEDTVTKGKPSFKSQPHDAK